MVGHQVLVLSIGVRVPVPQSAIMKKPLVVILVSLVCIISSVLLIDRVMNTDIINYLFPQKFNSAEWKNAWQQHQDMGAGVGSFGVLNVHRRMVYSLIRHENLLGLTKEEVINLIGIEADDRKEDHWNYWLNYTAADNRWLALDFENDKVADVSIYED